MRRLFLGLVAAATLLGTTALTASAASDPATTGVCRYAAVLHPGVYAVGNDAGCALLLTAGWHPVDSLPDGVIGECRMVNNDATVVTSYDPTVANGATALPNCVTNANNGWHVTLLMYGDGQYLGEAQLSS
jgi:hypothetical protein